MAEEADTRVPRAAAERLITHLRAIDPKERRRTALLRGLAAVAFNLLVVAGLLIAVLVWRGFV